MGVCPTCRREWERPEGFPRVDLDRNLLVLPMGPAKLSPVGATIYHVLLEAFPKALLFDTLCDKIYGVMGEAPENLCSAISALLCQNSKRPLAAPHAHLKVRDVVKIIRPWHRGEARCLRIELNPEYFPVDAA